MSEYGLFTDEGCIEAGFLTEGSADRARCMDYQDVDPDDIAVHEMCPDHEGQAKWTCELCQEMEEA